jgi:hypothetical protein
LESESETEPHTRQTAAKKRQTNKQTTTATEKGDAKGEAVTIEGVCGTGAIERMRRV